MTIKYKPKIGYASMNMDIESKSYRTCRKDNISNKKLKELIEHNLLVLEQTIDYNIINNNHFFRISSSLIPFGSSDLNRLDWASYFKEDFLRIRNKISEHNIRISMHPGQYTVLNSLDEKVVNNAIKDLEYHAKVLELLDANDTAKIIIHVGGVYNDKRAAINRFINVYNTCLSSTIKKYLVIENDDKLYTVEDVLDIHLHTSIPVVFDNLHHHINQSLGHLSTREILDRVVSTWKNERVKFHYSQQDKSKRIGAHSYTINMKQFINDYQSSYGAYDADIMLEVKDKNRSFVKINQYFNPSQQVLKKEWDRLKLHVMSRSLETYDKLEQLIEENKLIDQVLFYEEIDKVMELDIDDELELLTSQFIWKYFNMLSTDSERVYYQKSIKEKDITKLKKHFKRLALKYQIQELTESYYL